MVVMGVLCIRPACDSVACTEDRGIEDAAMVQPVMDEGTVTVVASRLVVSDRLKSV
jgi:hypothetical protein